MSELLTSIEFQMSLLMLAAISGYLISYKTNQSAVIGLIVVGIILGPSLLGLVTYTDFIKNIAHLGAIVLLFVVGTEFEIKDVFKKRYAGIALLGVILPWVSGYYLGQLFGFDFSSSVFIGTALTATSIAITANVLKEMGKLQSSAAKAIIGAAVIDDILALLALSLSKQLISGGIAYSSVAFNIIKTIGFIFIGAYMGNKVLTKLMHRMDKTPMVQRYPEFTFIFAIGIAFLYGTAAEIIGLSAIVGSFIAGASLSEVGLKHSRSYKEGGEYMRVIFASIFFISLGVLADLSSFSPNMLLFLAVLTVLAIVTKVVGCGLPARLQGMSKRDSLLVGFGMVPRGEMAMVISLIALTNNIISQELYVVLILMSLLTTVIPPAIIKSLLYGKTVKYNFKKRGVFRQIFKL